MSWSVDNVHVGPRVTELPEVEVGALLLHVNGARRLAKGSTHELPNRLSLYKVNLMAHDQSLNCPSPAVPEVNRDHKGPKYFKKSEF